MVHVDRLGRVDERHEASVAPFGRRPARRAFLGDADQDHVGALATVFAVPLDDGILAFTLPEFDPGSLC